MHFPYSYLRRTLSGILALRSPDFPHTALAARDCLSYPDPYEFQMYANYNVYGFVFASDIITSTSRPLSKAIFLTCAAMFSVKIFSVP